jgi:hypothetical protein
MKYFLISILFVLGINSIQAQNDTLRMHNPEFVNSISYNTNGIPTQIARFDLDKPAYIKGFIFTVDGNTGGTMDINFCGHEGGVSLIGLFNNIIPKFTITKKIDGKEEVWYPLADSIELRNTQFNIVMENFNNCKPITDQMNHPKACESSSGGTYYYQYGVNGNGEFVLFSSANRAFAIDVVLEYIDKESINVFEDITTSVGFEAGLSNASIAAADYNNDDFIDLLIRGKLYENQKDGTYKDVTDDKSISNPYNGVSANAFVDMDNDGDLDIILFGGAKSVLLVNNNNSFTEKVLSLPNFESFLSFSFADINFDNYPDLFVSQLWGAYPQAKPNFFFYNTGNNDFKDSTSTIYPKWDGTWNYPDKRWDPANYIIERNRNSRGSQWVDYDLDGDLDLYVTNYFLHKDELYQNNGDGTFTDVIGTKGIDVTNPGSMNEGANHGTGVDWYDYDNDGDFDLLLPQFAHPRFIGPYDHRGTTIYRNEGAPDFKFTDMVGQYNNYPGLKSDIGLELEETHAGGAWGDVNNDGLADFMMTVFYGCRYIDLYIQQEDHTFKLETFKYGFDHINTGTDIVWLDYNNDGALDLAGAKNNKFSFFVNTKFYGKSFLELSLKSTSANKFAIGAIAKVYGEGKMFTQQVSAGRGQKMQKPYRLHFGLGEIKQIDSVVITWPTKPAKNEVFTGIEINKIYNLTEGGNINVSQEEINAETLVKIYPNPAKDFVNIELVNNSSQNTHFVVYNALMQRVNNIELFELNTGLYSLSTAALPSGMYFCEIRSGDKKEIVKFVVKR